MSSTVVTGISELVTNDPAVGDGSILGLISNAAVVVEDGQIAWVGSGMTAPAADRRIQLGGRAVIPGFVDSHTHLAFAGDRVTEFVARMDGNAYDGGGIDQTVRDTRATSVDDLRALLAGRMSELRTQGTTTVEIKSGYGLDTSTEVRLLRLAGEFSQEVTFLGAHLVPAGVSAEEYVDLVTGEMMQACAPHARWIDVFCEPSHPRAFDADMARTILLAGKAAGLQLRVHANQLSEGPGVRLGVELGAASVDHCTYLSQLDVDALAGGTTVATLLPGAEFSTRAPYPDARRLLDAGVVVALATDCNPGSSYTSSMPFVIALAVREMGMTPAEALWSATAGSACSLARDDLGVVALGHQAELAVVEGLSHAHLAYRPGVPMARALIL
jgi:imidazolonepropionase